MKKSLLKKANPEGVLRLARWHKLKIKGMPLDRIINLLHWRIKVLKGTNLEEDKSIEEYEPGVFIMEAEVLYNKDELVLDWDDFKNDKN